MMGSSDVDTLRRMGQIEQRVGQIYDQIACTYVPLSTALSEAAGVLVGAALNIGVYSVGPIGSGATYTYNYPTTAKAVYVRLTAVWAAASSSNLATCYITGGGTPDQSPIARSHVANIASDATGNVTLDSSGKFSLQVAGANTTSLSLYVLGYFL
jgi:hypothetical protein